MQTKHDTVRLPNGVQMPKIGFGTWQSKEGDQAITAVSTALELGYRHIDTAAGYGNEKSVGIAVRNSGIPREEIFVTSKLPNSKRGYYSAFETFKQTMDNLELEYLDLYLIHWPASFHRFQDWEQINLDTWRAMTELYKQGKIKAIGVSNFLPHHLKALMETEVTPMVNQIELNPGCRQLETRAYCQQHGIVVEAWSPLGSGRILNDENLAKIAKKHNKSVAQVCLRWALQINTCPLPKSVTQERIKQNLELFDFSLDQEDLELIDKLPDFGQSGNHPDKVNW